MNDTDALTLPASIDDDWTYADEWDSFGLDAVCSFSKLTNAIAKDRCDRDGIAWDPGWAWNDNEDIHARVEDASAAVAALFAAGLLHPHMYDYDDQRHCAVLVMHRPWWQRVVRWVRS